MSPKLNLISEDVSNNLRKIHIKSHKMLLAAICKRPKLGLTEVRRDGKDSTAVIAIIKYEFERCKHLEFSELTKHMESFASACWVSQVLKK